MNPPPALPHSLILYRGDSQPLVIPINNSGGSIFSTWHVSDANDVSVGLPRYARNFPAGKQFGSEHVLNYVNSRLARIQRLRMFDCPHLEGYR